MQSSDRAQFIKVLSACLDTYGRERSDTVMALWWRLLEPYPLADVVNAMAAHMRASRFAPVPAEIIAAVTPHDGRPEPDEAWAMCPRSEYDSVFWTDEMAAAYGIAAPLLQHGDQVAARRAFLDRYGALVAKARAAGTPMKVTPSFGFDVAGREAAVQKAVERGLLPVAKAHLYLEHRVGNALALVPPVKAIQ